MKCEDCKRSIPDFLTGEVSPGIRQDIETHIAACDLCRLELENLTALWTKLGVLPQERPGDSLRSRFYTMLESYKEGLEVKRSSPFRPFLSWSGGLKHLWPRNPAFQFLTALLFLFIGLGGGIILERNGDTEADLSRLTREVQSVRQTLASSLLRQPSPGDRLRGISISAELDSPDPALLESLITTLDTDPNINVRLAAVDALYIFSDHPTIKESLVHSLSLQTSPLVQVALVDLLVDLRERRAVEALKQLINDDRIDPEVKARAETGLEKLTF